MTFDFSIEQVLFLIKSLKEYYNALSALRSKVFSQSLCEAVIKEMSFCDELILTLQGDI